MKCNVTRILFSFRIAADFGQTTYAYPVVTLNHFTDTWNLGSDDADILLGGSGNDYLWGGAGGDQLYGEADDDELNGQRGDDLLYGDAGNDRLFGDAGNDVTSGGDRVGISRRQSGVLRSTGKNGQKQNISGLVGVILRRTK